MATKRKAASSPKTANASTASKQAKQAGQKSVKKVPNVPIDEGAPTAGNAKVHVGDDATVYDASLNQSHVGNNNNKFYRMQLLSYGTKKTTTYRVWTRWGRLGDFGQTLVLGPFDDLDTAIKEYDKKFKAKTGLSWENREDEPKSGKYTYIQRNYEDSDDEEEEDKTVKKEEDDSKELVKSKLPIQTQRLVELIFDNNHFNAALEHMGYNANKLPLGKLGQDTLKKGFEHLKELASLIRHPKLAQNKYQRTQQEMLEEFTNKYYSTIPHVFGRQRPPVIDNDDILRKEVALLDDLSNMAVADAIMKTTSSKSKDTASISLIDKRFTELKCKVLQPVDKNTPEWTGIKDYLINTAGHTHNMRFRVQSIFRLERTGEEDRFRKSKYSKRPDTCRRLLWHGSRTTNFGGILSQGLRIAPPEAPVNGYAFGKGVYMADISTKSANYCSPYLSGGHGLILLVEAELGGKMFELSTGDFNAGELCVKQGCIATQGVGRTAPLDWVDAGVIHPSLKGVLMPDTSKDPGPNKACPQNGYLQYNEYIAYSVEQLRLRYLIRFTI